MISTDRAVIFIDGSNFYNGAKRNSLSPKVDFNKFSRILCKDHKFIETLIYLAPLPQFPNKEKYRGQQRFFSVLRRTPKVTLKLGRLEKRNHSYVEKGVDVLMAVDMISNAHQNYFDFAIIVTADADFVPAVNEIKRLGKKTINAYFETGFSYHLQSSCDSFICIDKDIITNSMPR